MSTRISCSRCGFAITELNKGWENADGTATHVCCPRPEPLYRCFDCNAPVYVAPSPIAAAERLCGPCDAVTRAAHDAVDLARLDEKDRS